MYCSYHQMNRILGSHIYVFLEHLSLQVIHRDLVLVLSDENSNVLCLLTIIAEF